MMQQIKEYTSGFVFHTPLTNFFELVVWMDYLSNYIVTEHHVKASMSSIVLLCNHVAGPRLVNTAHKGFGLEAERDYAKGEIVTFYGGTLLKGGATGSYVVDAGTFSVDGYFGFKLIDKGRWVNEADEGIKPNLEMRKTPRGKRLYFFATRDICKGEELTWFYGRYYDRTWLNTSL